MKDMKNKEKTITRILCVVACVVIWILEITILTILGAKKFTTVDGIILMALWFGACCLVKKLVHRHYHNNNYVKCQISRGQK